MIDTLLPMLFAGAGLTSLVVITVHLASIAAQARSIGAAMAGCPETREVKFVIRTINVVPEGGTVVRGRFSEGRRRPRPQDALPAAA